MVKSYRKYWLLAVNQTNIENTVTMNNRRNVAKIVFTNAAGREERTKESVLRSN
jgi:hypothetical protein